MFTCKPLLAFTLLGIASMSLAEKGPDLGIEATPAQVAAWDISIAPDGDGLPAGSGTTTQGAAIYAIQCIACHGRAGAGNPNDRLVGGHGTLGSSSPVKTIGSFWPYATTVFDYIRRAMPYTYSGTLTDDQVYALTAYLLFLNDIIDENDVMDAESLAKVQMPNRNNFVLAYPTNSDSGAR
ncbi:MAG: cytochrome c [Proteobacteria bacterium]|nr:cytochrome c [Pseudomonadota bacterium]